MSEQEPGPTHTPYGQPDPYGQPSPYGAPAQPNGDRRPGTVTAAAWITMVFAAIVAAIFGLTGLALVIARDQVITEMERVPEFQDTNIDADSTVGVLAAVMFGLVVWALIAIVLAIFVLRRSNVARILLVISSTVVALASLLTITSGVSAVLLIASVAVIVMLFAGGAGAWFKRLDTYPGGYPGGYPQAPTGYPAGQYGSPYGDQPGSSYGQDAPPQYPQAPQYPSADNPYGQAPGQDPYAPPPGAENPYGQPPQQPPVEGDGTDQPPRDYPNR
jgi:hypothetical protein